LKDKFWPSSARCCLVINLFSTLVVFSDSSGRYCNGKLCAVQQFVQVRMNAEGQEVGIIALYIVGTANRDSSHLRPAEADIKRRN